MPRPGYVSLTLTLDVVEQLDRLVAKLQRESAAGRVTRVDALRELLARDERRRRNQPAGPVAGRLRPAREAPGAQDHRQSEPLDTNGGTHG